nr:reverse transcriptase domain-containing protein [Tanacetum cinerariifolium]
MLDSEDSTVTYTEVSSPFEDLSDIGSQGVDGLPMMPQETYAYVEAALQALPSPDYVPGPEHPPSPAYVLEEDDKEEEEESSGDDAGDKEEDEDEDDEEEDPFEDLSDIGSQGVDGLPMMPQETYAYVEAALQAPPSPDYVPEDDVLPAEEQALPTVVSPTAASLGYILEFDLEEDPKEDEKDPEEDPANYPTDREDDKEEEESSGDDAGDKEEDEDEDDEEEELCIALGMRFKVGESSSASTARQFGDFRADYGFVSTLDDEIRQDPEREGKPTMTDVAGLSQRMTDLIMTVKRDTDEIYVRLDNAHDDRLLMSGQLNMMRKDIRTHDRTVRLMESEARLSQEAWVQSMEASEPARAETQMAVLQRQQGPTRGPVHPEVPEEASSTCDADKSQIGKDNYESGTRVRRPAPPAREKETVFRICNCTLENQIKFATCTLLGSALTWWNSHVKTVGPAVAYAITWINLKKNITDKYCPMGEIKKLKVELWNLKVKCTDVCAPKFHKCNMIGHLARDCKSTINANSANNQRGTRAGQKSTCFECGAQGHFKTECPKLKNNNHGNQGRNGNAPTKVYSVGHAGTNPDSNVITVKSVVGEVQLLSPKIVQETTEKIIQIKQRIQAARDRQKIYDDLKRKAMEFQFEDRVMLKVFP